MHARHKSAHVLKCPENSVICYFWFIRCPLPLFCSPGQENILLVVWCDSSSVTLAASREEVQFYVCVLLQKTQNKKTTHPMFTRLHSLSVRSRRRNTHAAIVTGYLISCHSPSINLCSSNSRPLHKTSSCFQILKSNSLDMRPGKKSGRIIYNVD